MTFKTDKLITLIFTTKFYKVHLIHEKWRRSTTKRIKLRKKSGYWSVETWENFVIVYRDRFISIGKFKPAFCFFFLLSNTDFYIHLTSYLNELD